MKITNKLGLPDAIVKAVSKNDYNKGSADYSVTQLLQPPRITELTRQHWDEIEEDVSDRIWALLGTVVHGILERAETVASVEERLTAQIGFYTCEMDEGFYTVSGKYDRCIVFPDGLLQDYKLMCLPGDTQVLTDNGFVFISEVRCGDRVLGYDMNTDKTEWTTVNNTVALPDSEVLDIAGDGYKVTCTPNHRWAVHYESIYKKVDGTIVRNPKRKYVTAENLKNSQHLLCAAPLGAAHPEIKLVLEEEAILLAWIVTDGYGTWKGKSPSFQISQKKQRGRDHIESKLSAYISSVNVRKDGVAIYTLKAGMVREAFSKLGYTGKSDLPGIVARLSKYNLKVFLEVMRLAEGNHFCQNPGPVLDAYIIGCSLEGYRVGFSTHPQGAKYVTRRVSRWIYHSGKHVVRTGEKVPVYCLNTALSSFVIKQGDFVSITGNSVWETIHGLKADREQQLNMLAWIARENGIDIKKLEVVAIYRDWSKGKAREGGNYPQRQVQTIPVALWDASRTEAFIAERIRLHEQAKVELPECSDEERWAADYTYAVMKQGNKRAVRVLATEDEAKAYITAEGKPGLYVVPRQADPVKRCVSYCPCLPFCQQAKDLGAIP